jgi:hypothetical protein
MINQNAPGIDSHDRPLRLKKDRKPYFILNCPLADDARFKSYTDVAPVGLG